MLKILSGASGKLRSRRFLVILAFGILIFFLYFWQLGILTPGYSPVEKIAASNSESLGKIVSDPTYAPHKILQFLLGRISDSAVLTRLPSALAGVTFVICFYFVTRKWFGQVTAVLSTFLFSSLPWLVISSRSASPDILLLAGIVFVALMLWLQTTLRYELAVVILALFMAVLAYIPGMLYFMLLTLYFWRQKISPVILNSRNPIIALAALLLVGLLVPLAVAAITSPEIALRLLLVPDSIPSIINVAKNAVWGILALTWSTRDGSLLSLGKEPLLNISVVSLSVFGLYILSKRALRELLVLMILPFLAIAAYSLSPDLRLMSLALPCFGLLVAAGLRYLYAEWRAIFPLNPIPRGVAIVLITALVSLNVTYGVRYALAAWPNAVSTKNSYVLK